MTEKKPLDREVAKRQPDTVFERPLEILDEVLLTKGEKLAALERWRQAIIEELKATSEGMPPDGKAAERTGVLEEIEETRRRLTEAKPDQT